MHFRYRVLYPDNLLSMGMTKFAARGYAAIFGGRVLKEEWSNEDWKELGWKTLWLSKIFLWAVLVVTAFFWAVLPDFWRYVHWTV